MFGFNAARSNGSGVVGVLTEERLVLCDRSLASMCQFSGLDRAQCFGMAGNVLALFEESRVTVMEQREPGVATRWHRVLSLGLTWLAHDCSVAVSGDTVEVMAASVAGVHVWTLDRRKRSVATLHLLEGRSVVVVQLCRRFAAAATTDGHVAIWRRHEQQQQRPVFAWFAESGHRICSLQFTSDETQCAAVCWDGSGALLARSDDSWCVTRLFSSPLLFASSSSRPGNPALCVFGADNVLHVLYNGGIKSHGKEGMNARWISCTADFEGFCRLDGEKSVALEREGLTLRIVNV
jgi:hypothetical protein